MHAQTQITTASMVLYNHVIHNVTNPKEFLFHFGHLARQAKTTLYRGVSLPNDPKRRSSHGPSCTSWTYSYEKAKTFAEKACLDYLRDPNCHQIFVNSKGMLVIDLFDAFASINPYDLDRPDFNELEDYIMTEEECLNIYPYKIQNEPTEYDQTYAIHLTSELREDTKLC